MKRIDTRIIFKTLFIIVFSFVLIPNTAFSENSNQKKWKEAESYVIKDSFAEASKLYYDIFKSEANNFNCAFKIGMCLINSEENQDINEAIDFLKMACENINPKYKDKYSEKKAPILSWYYLGIAYRLNKDYDRAIDCFKEYKKVQNRKEIKLFNTIDIDREIQTCNDAKEEFDTKRMSLEKIEIEGLGNANLRCPILAENANRLIFTNGKNNVFPPDINWQKSYNEGQMDAVYLAVRDNIGGKFHSPQNIESDLQIKYPHIPITATADGSELYLIVDKNDNGNIYMSKFENGKYQAAKKVKRLNSRKWESHASITADGTRIYFTSMRKGGYGGLDIWYSDRDDEGKWLKPINMGAQINTKYHEEMPYIMNNGNAIYFSSEGHINIGGFDMFYSNFDTQAKSWTKPQNLGFPFSTSGNDMGYIIENGSVFAFCPVNDNKRREGIGNCDCISLLHEEVPMLATVSGNVNIKSDSKDQTPDTRIMLVDKNNSEKIYETTIDENGNYLLQNIDKGSYDLIAFIDENTNQSKSIEIPQNGKWTIESQDFELTYKTEIIADNDEKDLKIQPLFIENVFFDFDKSNIKPEFNSNLSVLSDWLLKNPEAVVKVIGHTDHFGSEDYNVGLSSRRANSVKNYFIKNGVKNSQIIVQFLGETQPITVPVDDDNIRHLNRRVIFEIVKQGNPILEVKPILVPENFKLK